MSIIALLLIMAATLIILFIGAFLLVASLWAAEAFIDARGLERWDLPIGLLFMSVTSLAYMTLVILLLQGTGALATPS